MDHLNLSNIHIIFFKKTSIKLEQTKDVFQSGTTWTKFEATRKDDA